MSTECDGFDSDGCRMRVLRHQSNDLADGAVATAGFSSIEGDMFSSGPQDLPWKLCWRRRRGLTGRALPRSAESRRWGGSVTPSILIAGRDGLVEASARSGEGAISTKVQRRLLLQRLKRPTSRFVQETDEHVWKAFAAITRAEVGA